jgi:hypothetical protein
MKREHWLMFALAGVGALFLLSRTDKGAAVTAAAADSVGALPGRISSAVRGIRNNNPGNIRRTNDPWQGLSADQTDAAFFQFDAMEYGIRALCKILRKYYAGYHLATVRAIVSRWAPSNENDTGAYVAAVADYMGVVADDFLNLDDPATVFSLARGIIRQEVGTLPALLISDATVTAGVNLSLG